MRKLLKLVLLVLGLVLIWTNLSQRSTTQLQGTTINVVKLPPAARAFADQVLNNNQTTGTACKDGDIVTLSNGETWICCGGYAQKGETCPDSNISGAFSNSPNGGLTQEDKKAVDTYQSESSATGVDPGIKYTPDKGSAILGTFSGYMVAKDSDVYDPGTGIFNKAANIDGGFIFHLLENSDSFGPWARASVYWVQGEPKPKFLTWAAKGDYYEKSLAAITIYDFELQADGWWRGIALIYPVNNIRVVLAKQRGNDPAYDLIIRESQGEIERIEAAKAKKQHEWEDANCPWMSKFSHGVGNQPILYKELSSDPDGTYHGSMTWWPVRFFRCTSYRGMLGVWFPLSQDTPAVFLEGESPSDLDLGTFKTFDTADHRDLWPYVDMAGWRAKVTFQGEVHSLEVTTPVTDNGLTGYWISIDRTLVIPF